jgi:hypothetical protein
MSQLTDITTEPIAGRAISTTLVFEPCEIATQLTRQALCLLQDITVSFQPVTFFAKVTLVLCHRLFGNDDNAGQLHCGFDSGGSRGRKFYRLLGVMVFSF